jgi:HrpA-like RNA helicase
VNSVLTKCMHICACAATQVPQFLLDDEQIGPMSRIIVTQPRRLSAVSVAERVAKERGESVGGMIGYNIRMEHRYSRQQTQCLFVTPGVLLRKILTDPTLLEFSHVIIDEAHERDRFTEFLMIVLRDIVARRPTLKLVLMSATLHTDKISSYFGGVPHVHIGGSMFPVQEFFLEHVLKFTDYLNTNSKFKKIAALNAEISKPKLLSCPLCKSKTHLFRSPAELATHVALCTGTTNLAHNDAMIAATNATLAHQSSYKSGSGSSSLSTLQALVSNLRAGSSTPAFNAASSNAKPQSSTPQSSKSEDVAVDLEAEEVEEVEDSNLEDFLNPMRDAEIDQTLEENFNSSKYARDQSAVSISSDAATTAATPATWATDFEGSELMLRTYQGQWDDVYIDYDLILALINYAFESEFMSESGSILVFLPGWDDISTMHKLLSYSERYGDAGVYKLIQLHSGIPRLEQDEVFKSTQPGQHKIILSTNIAETSITIDDVVVVIDSGKLKERIYDPHVKLAFLKTTWISRAAARQRVGRAGRTAPGVCFHLFSRTRCLGLEPFQESELLRMPLEELVLQTKSLGLAPGCGEEQDSVRSFLAKALDPPHPLTTANAVRLLTDIGCFTDLEELTIVGKAISALPMDPRLGRSVLLGCVFGCGPAMCSIATAMGYRDPFVLPISEQQRELCNQVKRRFAEGIPSDQICLFRAFQHYVAATERLHNNYHKINKFCDEHFMSRSTMNSLVDMTQQLYRTLQEINITISDQLQRHNQNMHLLSALVGMCLYPNIAIRQANASLFASEKGPKTKLHPSSVNSKVPQYAAKAVCKVPLEVMGFDNLIAINMGVKSTPGSANLMMLNTTPISVFALMIACGSLREVHSLDVQDGDDDDENDDGEAVPAPATAANSNRVFVDIDSWIRVSVEKHLLECVFQVRGVIAKAMEYLLVSTTPRTGGAFTTNNQQAPAQIQFPSELLTCLNLISQVLVNEMPAVTSPTPAQVAMAAEDELEAEAYVHTAAGAAATSRGNRKYPQQQPQSHSHSQYHQQPPHHEHQQYHHGHHGKH